MRKTDGNLHILKMVFAVSLVISNVVSPKLIATGISIFGTEITLPGAALCYAITFLMTDVIGEIWGKKEANETVLQGFICQVLASLLILFTQYLPAVDASMQSAYEALLGMNYIFVTGSLAAYFVSQSWDVYIFHRIREYCVKKDGKPVKKWLRNNASTMTSQIFDTVIFSVIAFGLGYGWLFDSNTRGTLLALMVGQYGLKVILALLDTPFFYLLTRERHADEEQTCERKTC